MGAMGDMGGAVGAVGAIGGAAAIISVLKYVLITLVGGFALGLVGGFIFAGFKYPNPNKKQMFTPLQKIIVMVIAVLSIALIVFAFVKKPKAEGDMMVNGSDASMVDGAGDNGEPALDAEGNPIEVDGDEGGESTADESGEEGASGESSEESEESSSESSTVTAPPAGAGGGTVIIGGGGGAGFAMARPMM